MPLQLAIVYLIQLRCVLAPFGCYVLPKSETLLDWVKRKSTNFKEKAAFPCGSRSLLDLSGGSKTKCRLGSQSESKQVRRYKQSDGHVRYAASLIGSTSTR